MKELIINSILIADVNQKTAKFQEFKNGFNVITSSQNHVGKSSLIKSLYYSFGAEVEFDTNWDKNSKIYIVRFTVDKKNYRIARFQKKYVLLQDDELILFTEHVTIELAQKLEDIFKFGVYLPNRTDNTIELAPPVFMFMPYYIDQDRGWSEIYGSFSNLEQYAKDDRRKSLYYHLGIYNKKTVELVSEKDALFLQLSTIKEESERIENVVNVLSEELKNLVPAENIEELERNLIMPKEAISKLVKKLGEKRNEIQKLEIMLQNHKYQLEAINVVKYTTSTTIQTPIKNILSCPKCGYVMDKEIFEIVQKNYTFLNKKYAQQQVELLIQRIEKKLEKIKKEYVDMMNRLKAEESVYNDMKNNYDIYLVQKGLSSSLNNLTEKYEKNINNQKEITEKIKDITSELKKLPNKKEIEKKYVEFVIENLLSLGAWEASYEKKIKLLKPLKGQGTLKNKIILAQIIALFQTMDSLQIESNKFPFIIDSPRGNEASLFSSEEILKLIFSIDCIPQIILVTMDFLNFKDSINYKGNINIVELEQQYKLLSADEYTNYLEEIESLHELFSDFRKYDSGDSPEMP